MALNTFRSGRAPSMATLALLENALSNLRINGPTISQLGKRHASHQAQGRANGAKDGPGKRLGAKKTGGEYVIPGNILFKQRGTHWFPGDNCFMGRDHTIHAGAPGYVRYYRDPLRHPKRKYIGVVFEKEQVLPQAPNEPRRRKLGMLAYQMPAEPAAVEAEPAPTGPEAPPKESRMAAARRVRGMGENMQSALRPGYQYRRGNWEIGRLQDKVEAEAQSRGTTTRLYPDFKRGDRFAAWRKKSERIRLNMERRQVKRKGAGKSKK
nr:54s ribosomal protein l2, mitochondrial [Quercus suber]